MALRTAIAFLFSLLFWIPVVHGSTLESYISDRCSKSCVSSEALVRGTYMSAMVNDIDPHLLLAVVRVESAFNTKAKNVGNVGLTQTLLRYHRPKYKGRNVYDVNANLEVGGSVLRDCLKKRKGRMTSALRCYNGNADPQYPVKVLRALKEIRGLVSL